MEPKEQLERIISKCNEKKYDYNNDKTEFLRSGYNIIQNNFLILKRFDLLKKYRCMSCIYHKG